jgi:seryl-tRNA synthetase
MPLDITFIIKNPDLVKESETKRFRDPTIIDTILQLDDNWRSMTGQIDLLRKEKNSNQKQIALFYKSKDPEKANELKEKNIILDKQIVECEVEKKISLYK